MRNRVGWLLMFAAFGCAQIVCVCMPAQAQNMSPQQLERMLDDADTPMQSQQSFQPQQSFPQQSFPQQSFQQQSFPQQSYQQQSFGGGNMQMQQAPNMVPQQQGLMQRMPGMQSRMMQQNLMQQGALPQGVMPRNMMGPSSMMQQGMMQPQQGFLPQGVMPRNMSMQGMQNGMQGMGMNMQGMNQGMNQGMVEMQGMQGMMQPQNSFSGFGNMLNKGGFGGMFSKRKILQTLLGGGEEQQPVNPNDPNYAARKQEAINGAQYEQSIANSKADYAEGCEGRANYGERTYRMGAASEARSAANEAREAANRARSKANGFPEANSYADNASYQADRAESAANRAYSSAESAPSN